MEVWLGLWTHLIFFKVASFLIFSIVDIGSLSYAIRCFLQKQKRVVGPLSFFFLFQIVNIVHLWMSFFVWLKVFSNQIFTVPREPNTIVSALHSLRQWALGQPNGKVIPSVDNLVKIAALLSFKICMKFGSLVIHTRLSAKLWWFQTKSVKELFYCSPFSDKNEVIEDYNFF